jgi:hypothetical protein
VGVVGGPTPVQTAKNEPLPASISLRCGTTCLILGLHVGIHLLLMVTRRKAIGCD